MTTFTYFASADQWLGIAPVVVLVVMALVLMLVDLVLPHEGERSKHSGPANFTVLPAVALLGVLGSMAAAITLFFVGHPTSVFNNMLGADSGTLFADLIILVAGGLGILLSPAYLKRLRLVHQGEYYALLLLSMTGMLLMAGALSFLIVFVGLEMFSLALYILCGFIDQRQTSQESGMKYFLLSSFASAFLLYGIALIYAATGHTSFVDVQRYVMTQTHGQAPILLMVGLGLLTVGFAFKVSAVPFQTWTPDVYQGAPAPVTAFMSVGTKVAALLAFIRVFGFALSSVQSSWLPVVWAIAVLTVVLGNVMAVGQGNIKRLLAYSSIAHGGYLLIGVVVSGAGAGQQNHIGASAVLFYLSCYLFMNIGAFGVVSLLERLDNTGYDAADLRGLWYRRPWLAGLLAFFLLALAGFPPMAGFAAKYYLFYAALVGGHPELLVIGVVASVLGIYYYLRFIGTMFMEGREESPALAIPATPGHIPATPRTATKAPTGGLRRSASSTRGATAVAERPASIRVAAPPRPAVVSAEEPTHELEGWSWVAIGIAALGTLVTGVILPFWLPQIQQAAQSLLK
ncbi:NADH-quinone oxidoreductase subunit N [Dictyobacter aurantiacus]|uniref:NADH-quinone oxidoreductase subunit N n=1 Tax=Dictyobacter aurantiacus TaxID=1936993 RepID=A0A401ZDE1_9CHLR|nr:NADH-quinone oxidoreductase subunit N [Dictyobacter aurantiacus]GCE04900.1 NADH-quinone oxidoreductase subunit N [Dictyobacter aurantiacus]